MQTSTSPHEQQERWQAADHAALVKEIVRSTLYSLHIIQRDSEALAVVNRMMKMAFDLQQHFKGEPLVLGMRTMPEVALKRGGQIRQSAEHENLTESTLVRQIEYVQIMERAWFLMASISAALSEHPLIRQDRDSRALTDRARKALFDLHTHLDVRRSSTDRLA